MKNFFKENKALLLCGLAAGAVNGFFGGGAGMVLVPLLKRAAKMKTKNAHASSVLVTLVLSTVTLATYLVGGRLEKITNLWHFVIGSTVGGALGALLLKRASPRVIRVVFSLFMVFSGVRMIIG